MFENTSSNNGIILSTSDLEIKSGGANLKTLPEVQLINTLLFLISSTISPPGIFNSIPISNPNPRTSVIKSYLDFNSKIYF